MQLQTAQASLVKTTWTTNGNLNASNTNSCSAYRFCIHIQVSFYTDYISTTHVFALSSCLRGMIEDCCFEHHLKEKSEQKTLFSYSDNPGYQSLTGENIAWHVAGVEQNVIHYTKLTEVSDAVWNLGLFRNLEFRKCDLFIWWKSDLVPGHIRKYKTASVLWMSVS